MPDTETVQFAHAAHLGRLAEARRSTEQAAREAREALREGCLQAFADGLGKSELSRAAGVSRTALDAWIKEDAGG